jgi:chromosome segregation ATPase
VADDAAAGAKAATKATEAAAAAAKKGDAAGTQAAAEDTGSKLAALELQAEDIDDKLVMLAGSVVDAEHAAGKTLNDMRAFALQLPGYTSLAERHVADKATQGDIAKKIGDADARLKAAQRHLRGILDKRVKPAQERLRKLSPARKDVATAQDAFQAVRDAPSDAQKRAGLEKAMTTLQRNLAGTGKDLAAIERLMEGSAAELARCDPLYKDVEAAVNDANTALSTALGTKAELVRAADLLSKTQALADRLHHLGSDLLEGISKDIRAGKASLADAATRSKVAELALNIQKLAEPLSLLSTQVLVSIGKAKLKPLVAPVIIGNQAVSLQNKAGDLRAALADAAAKGKLDPGDLAGITREMDALTALARPLWDVVQALTAYRRTLAEQ